MPIAVVHRAIRVMVAVIDLERQLFLAGMLTTTRAAQLRVVKAAMEAALDFIPDIHAVRSHAEEAAHSDTGVANTIVAKLFRQ